jgi:hypothetical protein
VNATTPERIIVRQRTEKAAATTGASEKLQTQSNDAKRHYPGWAKKPKSQITE